MVSNIGTLLIGHLVLLAAQVEEPVRKSVDSVAKFKLFAMLILLSMGGVALVTLSWLYLRTGRRVLNRTDPSRDRKQSALARGDDWLQTPPSSERAPRTDDPEEAAG